LEATLPARSRASPQLYVQNFEKGFRDPQLAKLLEVLKLGRIWAVNVGCVLLFAPFPPTCPIQAHSHARRSENFNVSLPAWRAFANELPQTNVQYMYASEHHFMRTDLKTCMRDAIRANRVASEPHDPAVIRCVGNMWWRVSPLARSRHPSLHTRQEPEAARAAHQRR